MAERHQHYPFSYRVILQTRGNQKNFYQKDPAIACFAKSLATIT